MATVLWVGRKHILGQPISFTFYKITDEKLFIRRGVLSTQEEEVYLYKVKDKRFHQSPLQKILNVGSITLTVSDGEMAQLEIENIKEPFKVKQLLDKMIGDSKTQHGLHGSEMFGSSMK